MPIPVDTMQSLERLNAFQDDFTEESLPQWKRFLSKKDSLFLLMLIIGLFSFGMLLLLLVNKNIKKSADVKPQPIAPQEKPDVLEIPLGEFESMKNSRIKPGYISVIEYETTLSMEGSMLGLMQKERVILSRKNRLRSIVEVVVNNASPQELNEPDLKTIRVSILEDINNVLGEDAVNEVLFPHFVTFDLPGLP